MRLGDLDHLLLKLDAELNDNARYIDIADKIRELIDNVPTVEVPKVKCKNKDKYWCYSQCPYADTCENGTYER